MSEKKLKTIRRTVLVVAHDQVPITERALQWEAASPEGNRNVYRVERATPGSGLTDAGELYMIDMELTCKGANRNDFTKFVRTYLPEVHYHYITE